MRLETRWRQRLRESLEPFLVDHLGAHASDAPGREIERFSVLRADATRGQRVAKRRAEGNGRAVLRDQLQPQARTHGELARAHEIAGTLRSHAAQHDADQTHVVVVRQPREEAVFLHQAEALVEDRIEVMHHAGLRDHRAARKARAARGVLQVSQFFRPRRLGQLALVRQLVEIFQCSGHRHRQADRSLAQQLDEFARREGSGGLAVEHHLAQMADVGIMATKVDGRRQRHRHEGRVLAGVEHHHEVGMRVGHERNTRAASQPLQSTRQKTRLFTQFAVRQRGGQLTAAVVIVEARQAASGIVEGFRKRAELRATQLYSADRRRRHIL